MTAAANEPVLGPLAGHNDWVTAVAAAVRDGQQVVISGSHDRTVRVWDLHTVRSALGPLAGHDGRVTAVAAGVLDGQPVIISGGGRTVRVWDLESEPQAPCGSSSSIGWCQSPTPMTD